MIICKIQLLKHLVIRKSFLLRQQKYICIEEFLHSPLACPFPALQLQLHKSLALFHRITAPYHIVPLVQVIKVLWIWNAIKKVVVVLMRATVLATIGMESLDGAPSVCCTRLELEWICSTNVTTLSEQKAS